MRDTSPGLEAQWDAIEQLLDRALELEPGEQEVLLRRAGSDDPALEAAVRRLLDAGRRAGPFLELPAALYAGPLLAWAAAAEPLEPGASLGTYEIVRWLGRGATATVYLARDPKHHRSVAVKVLHPHLAAAVGADRFLREIEIAATLQHPHILPLFDSGRVAAPDGGGDLLYYVMPYVEGQSLRQTLTSRPRLPAEHALRIAREVAGALDYSHRRGVVHRDIKPENILLQDGQAIVADFGIARAIDAADARAEPATGTGTPAYMSPEQLAPGAEVDGRTDLYSLGCVLYEMLAGLPLYTAVTRDDIRAQHDVAASLPRLRSVRPDTPPWLEAVVVRALARAPADRFASAHEMALALAGAPSAPLPRVRRLTLAGGTAVALAVAGWVATARRIHEEAASMPLDASLVAVLPFRVPPGEPALANLEDGFADLLAAQLPGEGGLRAAEPRVVMGAWQATPAAMRDGPRSEGALRVARQLGADRIVDGAIAGTRSHLIVTASMLAGKSGRVVARSSVEGPLDSLAALARRVAGELLTSQAGEGRRLADLTAVPLTALRAYLDGQAALRHGQWNEAVRRFNAALDGDSTFALAGLGLAEAAGWSSTGDDGRGGAIAWAHRDQLSPQDRLLLSASVGPRYPFLSTQAQRIDAMERAVRAVPDRPELWYQLGDIYYHWGAGAGVQMARARQLAATAFRRAIDLDSTITRAAPSAEPLVHLGQIAANEGDTATVRRVARLGFADSGVGALTWRAAWALGDTAALQLIRARFDTMSASALEGVVTRSVEDGLPLDDAERAVKAMVARATTQDEIGRAQFERYLLSMSAGRPMEAVRVLQGLGPGTQFFHGITGELYWDGDSAFARAMARSGAVRADAPLSRRPSELAALFWDICWVERWRVAHGELGNTRRAIARLRSPVTMGGGGIADSSRTAEFGTLCADVLEASLATARHEPGAPLLVSRLNARLRTVPPGWTYGDNLAVARLLAASGNYADALAAVRRRSFDMVPVYLSTYLREEGRLAALVGDTNGAIAAYRHYLTLQAHPESAVASRVAEVRAALDRLLAAAHP